MLAASSTLAPASTEGNARVTEGNALLTERCDLETDRLRRARL